VPKRKTLKPIPRFESEDAEREFWATHDSTDFVDWSRAEILTGPPQPNPSRTLRTLAAGRYFLRRAINVGGILTSGSAALTSQ